MSGRSFGYALALQFGALTNHGIPPSRVFRAESRTPMLSLGSPVFAG